jgi:hypothetical protein
MERCAPDALGAGRFPVPNSTLRPPKNGEPGGSTPESRRRTRRRRIVAAAGVLVALWAAAVAVDLVLAAEHLHHDAAAGRQLRSVEDLSGAALQVARTGVTTVGRSQSLLRLPTPPDRTAWRRTRCLGKAVSR